MSIYLSPQTPRWTPQTESDLQSAIDEGLLNEGHRLELKREIDHGRGANRELARDLSSLAVDGGTLIVGVAETDSGLTLAPQPLAGLPERIEQVARTIPDPPLAVVSRPIPSNGDFLLGYLVVTVPPSGQAPHMVDHRYLGRGDKTKQYLSDAEVLRLHERRRKAEIDMLTLLDAAISRDPVPADERQQAHLFLVAEPLPGRSAMLLNLVSGPGWQQRVISLRDAGMDDTLSRSLSISEFSPDLDHASSQQRRPHGAALASYRLGQDRALQDKSDRENIVEFEVDEDGQLRVFCGRFSDFLGDTTNAQVLFDAGAVLLVRRFLLIIAAASEQAGYLGTWGLGVAATGLRGLKSYEMVQRSRSGPAYGEDIYRRVTAASYTEIIKTPGTLANALLGRLLRALGTDAHFTVALSDPPSSH